MERNPVVETYSRLASEYDSAENQASCWGHLSRSLIEKISIDESFSFVADVGCGTGVELARLAAVTGPSVRFIGVEPAERMRELAAARTAQLANVRVLDGSFEAL